MSIKYKAFEEKQILSEDERETKGYEPGYIFQPGRGRIPDKYIYYKLRHPRGAVNNIARGIASIPAPAMVPYEMPPPTATAAAPQGFYLQPPTLVVNNIKRGQINASVRAALAPRALAPPSDPEMNALANLLENKATMRNEGGGRRRKSRRNLKKKGKKTHRRIK